MGSLTSVSRKILMELRKMLQQKTKNTSKTLEKMCEASRTQTRPLMLMMTPGDGFLFSPVCGSQRKRPNQRVHSTQIPTVRRREIKSPPSSVLLPDHVRETGSGETNRNAGV
mmetsp:Transcript_20558/g.41090  ORF Transcript_20558/g.41090 Transcript_20558/m.41090 type:complete len:112 (+) Transcript_20558:3-338(+)